MRWRYCGILRGRSSGHSHDEGLHRQLSRVNAEMKARLTHDRERLHNPGLDLTQNQWVRGCKFGRPLGVE